MSLAAGGRLEKCAGTPFPIKTTTPLNGRQRHSKDLNDLSLGCRAIDDELGGEQPKAGQVGDAVRENRQMPVEISHLVLPPLKSKLWSNGSAPGRKHGQLKLRHGKHFPSTSPTSKPKKHSPTLQTKWQIGVQPLSTTSPCSRRGDRSPEALESHWGGPDATPKPQDS